MGDFKKVVSLKKIAFSSPNNDSGKLQKKIISRGTLPGVVLNGTFVKGHAVSIRYVRSHTYIVFIDIFHFHFCLLILDL